MFLINGINEIIYGLTNVFLFSSFAKSRVMHVLIDNHVYEIWGATVSSYDGLISGQTGKHNLT